MRSDRAVLEAAKAKMLALLGVTGQASLPLVDSLFEVVDVRKSSIDGKGAEEAIVGSVARFTVTASRRVAQRTLSAPPLPNPRPADKEPDDDEPGGPRTRLSGLPLVASFVRASDGAPMAKVELDDIGNGTYEGAYLPSAEAFPVEVLAQSVGSVVACELRVDLLGTPLGGSPIPVRVMGGVCSPRSTVSAVRKWTRLIEAGVQTPVFVVTARLADGSAVGSQTGMRCDVESVGSVGALPADCSFIVDEEALDGSFTVHLLAPLSFEGLVRCAVKLGGEAVEGSPFSVHVAPPLTAPTPTTFSNAFEKLKLADGMSLDTASSLTAMMVDLQPLELNAVAHAFRRHGAPCVRQANLSHNPLGDEGVEILSRALHFGTWVTRVGGQLLHTEALGAMQLLKLTGCQVSDDGAIALSAALIAGALPELQSISLDANRVGDRGLGGLGLVLLDSGAMPRGTHLWLTSNPHTAEGRASLEAACVTRPRLQLHF